MKVIILFGKPGSGKDTQMKLLAKSLHCDTIAMGSIIRQRIDELPENQKEKMKKGNFINPELATKLFLEELESRNGEVIISDGFPRTIEQAKIFEQRTDDYVTVYLDITDEEAMHRIIKRAEIEHRPDDSKEAVERRLKLYKESTEPVISILKQKGEFITVDGMLSIDEVNKVIMEKLTYEPNR